MRRVRRLDNEPQRPPSPSDAVRKQAVEAARVRIFGEESKGAASSGRAAGAGDAKSSSGGSAGLAGSAGAAGEQKRSSAAAVSMFRAESVNREFSYNALTEQWHPHDPHELSAARRQEILRLQKFSAQHAPSDPQLAAGLKAMAADGAPAMPLGWLNGVGIVANVSNRCEALRSCSAHNLLPLNSSWCVVLQVPLHFGAALCGRAHERHRRRASTARYAS
jgi:hypothetical protein